MCYEGGAQPLVCNVGLTQHQLPSLFSGLGMWVPAGQAIGKELESEVQWAWV